MLAHLFQLLPLLVPAAAAPVPAPAPGAGEAPNARALAGYPPTCAQTQVLMWDNAANAPYCAPPPPICSTGWYPCGGGCIPYWRTCPRSEAPAKRQYATGADYAEDYGYVTGYITGNTGADTKPEPAAYVGPIIPPSYYPGGTGGTGDNWADTKQPEPVAYALGIPSAEGYSASGDTDTDTDTDTESGVVYSGSVDSSAWASPSTDTDTESGTEELPPMVYTGGPDPSGWVPESGTDPSGWVPESGTDPSGWVPESGTEDPPMVPGISVDPSTWSGTDTDAEIARIAVPGCPVPDRRKRQTVGSVTYGDGGDTEPAAEMQPAAGSSDGTDAGCSVARRGVHRRQMSGSISFSDAPPTDVTPERPGAGFVAGVPKDPSTGSYGTGRYYAGDSSDYGYAGVSIATGSSPKGQGSTYVWGKPVLPMDKASPDTDTDTKGTATSSTAATSSTDTSANPTGGKGLAGPRPDGTLISVGSLKGTELILPPVVPPESPDYKMRKRGGPKRYGAQ